MGVGIWCCWGCLDGYVWPDLGAGLEVRCLSCLARFRGGGGCYACPVRPFLSLFFFSLFLPLLGGRCCNSGFLYCAFLLVIHYILCLVCTSILW